ncbi:MAG: hypothetical protein K9G29_06010 [Crocinitomicaceae bacterium]|nr:hypothetical protein [Crocinitomicaceae bacterium]
MKKLFIGIDVSKDVFDVCSMDESGNVIASKEVFSNTKVGIAYSGGNCATHSGDTVPLIPVI